MGVFGQELVVTALRDGGFAIPRDILDASGVPESEGSRAPVFAFAIGFGSETWLVDAGAGPCLGAEGGRVDAAMRATGIEPSDVTCVLLTHLHPDHVGGLSDEGGRPSFPKALVVLPRREHDDWLSPAARASHGADAEQVAAWAERALCGYRLRLIDGDGAAEVGRGVAALPAPGHRAGHMAYRLGRTEGALFVGDALHLPSWQLRDPSRGLTWDADPAVAGATRRRLLGLAADGGLLVAGAHWGLARVARAGQGFRALDP